MLNLKSQIGEKYKNYLVLEEFIQNNQKYVKVKCDCGEIKNIRLEYARNKKRAPNCQSCCVWKSFKAGEEINGFTVIKYFYDKSNPKKGITRIEVKCKCGEVRLMSSAQLKRTIRCSNCRLIKLKKTGELHPSYRGTKNISKLFYSSIFRSAKRRNIEFDITIDFLETLFLKQNKKCVYTNLDIVIGNNSLEQTASLDRIDNTKGYLQDNVQFVHKDVNLMKLDLTEKYFLELNTLIYKHTIERKK